MSYLSNKKAAEIVQSFEEKLDLLRYSHGGWCLWPRIRWHVIRAIQHRPDDKPKSNSLNKMSILNCFFQELWGMLITKPSNNFIYTMSRFRCENYNGLSKDIFFDGMISNSLDTFIKCEQRTGRGFTPYNVKCFINSNFSLFAVQLFLEKVSQLMKSHSYENKVESLCNDIEPYLENTGLNIENVKRKLYEFYYSRYFYRFMFKKLGIKRFLFVNQPNSMIAAAKELGIETIEFQHGLTDRYEPMVSWSGYAKKYKKFMAIPDKILLYGTYFVDELKKTGFWNQELIAVGNQQIEKNRKKINQVKGADDPIKIFLATQGFNTENLITFMKNFMNTIKQKVELIIKLHPQYDTSSKFWIENFTSYDNVLIIDDNNIPTLHLINECDLHLSIWSTTHYEAIGLGKPTVVLPLEGWENVKDLVVKGYAYFVNDHYELQELIKRCDWERKDYREISENFYLPFSMDNIFTAISSNDNSQKY